MCPWPGLFTHSMRSSEELNIGGVFFVVVVFRIEYKKKPRPYPVHFFKNDKIYIEKIKTTVEIMPYASWARR